MTDNDRTASLMSPATLARMKARSPASPGDWLNRMAADVGRAQVESLGIVGRALQTQAAGRDIDAAVSALQALTQAQGQLDFGLLQSRGWWARTTGKARSAGGEFAAQVEQIAAAMKAVGAHARTAQGPAAGDAADHTLVDMEVENGALEKIVEQGAKWLQDMRGQLQQRHAAAAADPAAQQQVRDDVARCEILVVRLKALRALGALARQVLQQVREVQATRLAVSRQLGETLPAGFKTWNARLLSLASAAAGGSDGPALGVEAPMEIHQQIAAQVAQATTVCASLREQEQSLAASLQSLELQVAAVLQD